LDALFGEESGDEDYDPSAPDPLASPGGGGGGSGGEFEEPEYASDGEVRVLRRPVLHVLSAVPSCVGAVMIL